MSDPTEQPAPTGPYAQAAAAYWRSGWKGCLPVPYGRKTPVPTGYTGTNGAWPSYPDVHAWTEQRGADNIALRLPPDVLGIDVDQYDAKPGGLVLADLEQRLGQLPATWRTTSRDDGISGIRLYRIPAGLRWPGVLGPGIETIRHEHRYALAWPSAHPKGGTYRWITPSGAVAINTVPAIDELPTLPATWVEHFTKGEQATDQPRAELSAAESSAWLTARGAGWPCPHMQTALDKGMADLRSGTSRHDATLSLTNRLIWLAGEGHKGLNDALGAAERAFVATVGSERGDTVARSEFARMVLGAMRIAAAAHPTLSPDPCLDPFGALIIKENPWTSPATSPALPTPSSESQTSSPTPPPNSGTTPRYSEDSKYSASANDAATADPILSEAGREVASRFQQGGAFILDIPANVPAIWGKGEDVLWSEGESLTICGPPGVGKTTLTGQVLRARLVGGEVLGLPVALTTSKVLYLAMDRPRQIARALRRSLGDVPREILDERLVVWRGPPIADMAAHPETLIGLAQLAGADTVIIDSIKDAAVGLSSDEVGAGYNRARQMCTANGIEVLEQHHMVKKGDNGGKPTSLADLYGSVWISAGSGSVLLLHGSAGDPIVEMIQLKTPAGEVGPYRLIHDHQAGTTTIWHQTDILAMAKAAGHVGLTAKAVASSIASKDNVSHSDIEKARRKLDALAKSGALERREGARGGAAASWVWVQDVSLEALAGLESRPESNHESNHGHVLGEVITEQSWVGPPEGIVAGQGITDQITAITEPQITIPPPPLKGGGSGGRTSELAWRRSVVAGDNVEVNYQTGEVREIGATP